MEKKRVIPTIIVVLAAIIVIIVVVSIIYGFVEDKIYDAEEEKEFEEIEYVIPEGFEKGYSHSYNYYNEGLSCSVYIDAYEKYEEDFKKWFKGTIVVNLNDEVGEMKEISVNGGKGYTINTYEKYNDEHHYAFESTNYYYKLVFRTSKEDQLDKNEDIGIGSCANFEDKIIESIKLK